MFPWLKKPTKLQNQHREGEFRNLIVWGGGGGRLDKSFI